jgi:hypothetical protein
MASPLPPLLENGRLSFPGAGLLVVDDETGLSVPDRGTAIEFVVFIKPEVGTLGVRKLAQFIPAGADYRRETLECYLIRPMEIPEELLYRDDGTLTRIDAPVNRKGRVTEIKEDTRIPLVTTIVGRHLYLTVEWTNHG